MLPSSADGMLARGIAAYRRSSTGTKAMFLGSAGAMVGGGAYMARRNQSLNNMSPGGIVSAGATTYGAAGMVYSGAKMARRGR